jgi:hypothetical protein
VGKAEDGAGEKTGPASGTATEEGIPRAGAQRGGDFQRAFADGLEGVWIGCTTKGSE